MLRGRAWSGGSVRAALALATLSLVIPPMSSADGGAYVPGLGYAQGSENAPVTIRVFSSLTCSSCAKLHLETLKPLIGTYVADGRVQVVHCLLPSPRDPIGLRAARCVHAARRLHRSEDVTTALFSTQRTWMLNGNLDPVLADVLSAEEMKRLGELVTSGELDEEVLGEIEAGRRARVRATPTMFIRHGETTTPIVGAVSYGILSRYLDKLLKDS